MSWKKLNWKRIYELNYKSNKNEEENIYFFFLFWHHYAFLVSNFPSCFVWRIVIKKEKKKKIRNRDPVRWEPVNWKPMNSRRFYIKISLSTIPRVMLSDAIDTIKNFFALQDYKDGESNWKFEIARFTIFLPVLLILTLTLTLILSQRIYTCSDIFFFLRSAYPIPNSW